MKFLILKIGLCISVFALVLNTKCNDDTIALPANNCDAGIIINEAVFENSTSNYYNSINAEIIDDCLLITVTASGCSGESWEMSLIDSGNIAESSPPQRHLKFILINNESCLAIVGKTQSFDLSALQIENGNEISLNIQDFPEALLYSY